MLAVPCAVAAESTASMYVFSPIVPRTTSHGEATVIAVIVEVLHGSVTLKVNVTEGLKL